MEQAYSSFKQLDKSTYNWKIIALVTRVWKVLQIRTEVVLSVDFVLMDKNGDQIHESVKRNFYDRFKDVLQERNVLHLENFNVEEKVVKYFCPVRHKYNISFKADTKFEQLHKNITFPEQHFEFTEFENLPERVNDNRYLIDIIGVFNEIEDVDIESIGRKKKNLIIDNKSGKTLRITFWENVFSSIPMDLNSNTERIVLIITSTTAKQHGEEVYLQASFATKVYMNMNIPEVESLKDVLQTPRVVLPPTRKRQTTSAETKKINEIQITLENSIKAGDFL